MKKNIAHQVIVSLHRIFIPKVNEELRKELEKILPKLNLTSEALVENPKVDDIKIEEVFNSKPDLKINTNPKLPTDKHKGDAKQELLKKMNEQKKKQSK